MSNSPLKIAVIAGEKSGDLLATDLIKSLKSELEIRGQQKPELIGVGGDGLQAEGLKSLFDYSELSLIGFVSVIKQLPKLLFRIRQTAEFIIESKPDLLLIVDSPDFTHRVARKVRAKCPDLTVINYVCPTVWAWKPERAEKMHAYVDHVLSIFPFEPEKVASLNGPGLTYIGHRLLESDELNAVRDTQKTKKLGEKKTFLLLPGSRRSEISKLLPIIGDVATELCQQFTDAQFIIPTLPKFQEKVAEIVEVWPIDVRVVTEENEKWESFKKADAALAASGTVLLELALARVPCVSIYKTDFILKLLSHKITTWTAALPNLIVGYPAISEHIDHTIRSSAVARRLTRLVQDTPERQSMIEAFDKVYDEMKVDRPPSEHGAEIVLSILDKKRDAI